MTPVEDRAVSLAVMIERGKLREIGDDWLSVASYIALHCHRASRDLDSAEPLENQFRRLQHLRVGLNHRQSKARHAGLFLIGSALAQSFWLGGEAIALDLVSAQAASREIIQTSHGRLSEHDRRDLIVQASLRYHRHMRIRLIVPLALSSQFGHVCDSPVLVDWCTRLLKLSPGLAEHALAVTRPMSPAVVNNINLMFLHSRSESTKRLSAPGKSRYRHHPKSNTSRKGL